MQKQVHKTAPSNLRIILLLKIKSKKKDIIENPSNISLIKLMLAIAYNMIMTCYKNQLMLFPQNGEPIIKPTINTT